MDIRTVPRDALTEAETTQIIELCSEVFRLDYRFYMNLDLPRVHFLGYAGERLAAHALWLLRRLRIGTGAWFEAAYVEGVATHADFRGRGYGSAVMRRLQQEISGYELGALSPSEPGWYERLGWERWQGPLFIVKDGAAEVTPDECVLIYRTPKTGALDLAAPLTGEWRPFELW
jgi:aminoglycoside 2'-N-acetyltransferase I